MRGGSVVVLAGSNEVNARGDRIEVKGTDQGLIDLLAAYGVNLRKGFVLDPQNARFPVPITEQRGMFTFQRILYMDYPFFVDVRSDGFGSDRAALAGLNNVVLNWSSQIELGAPREGVDAQELLESSPGAWILETEQVLPETIAAAETAFPPTGDSARRGLAVTVTGRVPSYFAEKPSPLFGEGDAGGASEGASAEQDRTGRTIKEANAEARLAVVGSSAFASDFVQQLGEQIGATGGLYRGNFQLVRNLIDWATEDTELLRIRGVGAFARTLVPLSDAEKSAWEFANYAFVSLALGGIVVMSILRRRRTVPIELSGERA
jgi:ABC-2 type transport system permease protein